MEKIPAVCRYDETLISIDGSFNKQSQGCPGDFNARQSVRVYLNKKKFPAVHVTTSKSQKVHVHINLASRDLLGSKEEEKKANAVRRNGSAARAGRTLFLSAWLGWAWLAGLGG